MPINTFSDGAVITAAGHNENWALAVLTDTARTITVTHTYTASQTFTGGWTIGADASLGAYGLATTTFTVLKELTFGSGGGAKAIVLGVSGSDGTGSRAVSLNCNVAAVAGASFTADGIFMNHQQKFYMVNAGTTDWLNVWSLTATGGTKFLNTIAVGAATPSTSGAGITFPASQSASSDANTLDDYEENTWTPGISFGGGTTGLTYTTQSATYTKIGRLVYVKFRITLSAKGSSTGAALLTGLPFTVANTTSVPEAAIRVNALTFAGRPQLTGVANSTTAAFTEVASAGTATDITDADFVDTTTIQGCMTYEAT